MLSVLFELWHILVLLHPGIMSCAASVTNSCVRVVAGNEGYGLRPTVKRCCTQLVQIEMATAAGSDSSAGSQLVDSLNVSVATGILLHHLLTAARQ